MVIGLLFGLVIYIIIIFYFKLVIYVSIGELSFKHPLIH